LVTNGGDQWPANRLRLAGLLAVDTPADDEGVPYLCFLSGGQAWRIMIQLRRGIASERVVEQELDSAAVKRPRCGHMQGRVPRTTN
jgi:hypothetical protein